MFATCYCILGSSCYFTRDKLTNNYFLLVNSFTVQEGVCFNGVFLLVFKNPRLLVVAQGGLLIGVNGLGKVHRLTLTRRFS